MKRLILFFLFATCTLFCAQAPRNLLAPVGELNFPGVNVTSLAFAPHGILAVGTSFGEIELWNTNNGRKIKNVWQSRIYNIGNLSFSQSGKMLASCAGNEISLWNIGNNLSTTRAAHLPLGLRGRAASISPNEKLLAVGFESGFIWLWDIINRNMITILQGNIDNLCCLSFSPDMKTLASGYRNGTIRLWKAPHYSTFTDLPADSQLNALAYSPYLNILAAGYEDGTIRLWNVQNNQPAVITTIREHTNEVNALAFNTDGILASGSSDNTIRLWNITQPQTPRQISLLQLNQPIHRLAFSPDGDGILASTEMGQTIQLWQLKA